MKISILDQAPVYNGQSPETALLQTAKLAEAVDKWGYTRFWVTEHHGAEELASTAPEVLLAYIGSVTKRIRLGSGALLLPYYRPYKAAECFHTLSSLFPGRVDLGIGRAPGGSAEASSALSNNYLQQVYKMPDLVEELLHFLYGDFPEGHPFANLAPMPLPETKPEVWILGTSKKSAGLAAAKGTAFAFGQFMSGQDPKDCLDLYRNQFQRQRDGQPPAPLAAVSVICADTQEKAAELVRGYKAKWMESHGAGEEEPQVFAGTPKLVKEQLLEFADRCGLEELMITTPVLSFEDKLHSLELLAEALIE